MIDFRIFHRLIQISIASSIDSGTVTVDPNSAIIPPYVRFNFVNIDLGYGFDSIVEKAPPFLGNSSNVEFWRQLQHAVSASSLIFYGKIDSEERSCFADMGGLLMYLGDYFLQIFNRCRCYEFAFALGTEKSAAGPLLTEFLQLPTIKLSKSVIIRLYLITVPAVLPFECIDNWLTSSGAEASGNLGDERFLHIYLTNIQNLSDVIDHFTEVLKFV